jgi:tryptophan synthase beta chain
LSSANALWLNLFPAVISRIGETRVASLRRTTEQSVALERLLSEECRRIEEHEGQYRTEARIEIPNCVRDQLLAFRPTPLLRAERWEHLLGFQGQIWIKREDLTPSGSHKYNTALAQAHYAREQDLKGIVTDTGAGQWGVALAMACAASDLRNVVFMPGHSYDRKEYRRLLMQAAGAEVYCSPSSVTAAGRIVCSHPDEEGRLSQAMSEAFEYAATHDEFCLGQGCMSFYAPLHQSIIGLETEADLAALCIEPDLLVACAGGGTNLSGFMAPWLEDALLGRSIRRSPRLIAVESSEVPALTKGTYGYDSPDACGVGDELLMFSLGSEQPMPDLDAAGLRYHAKSPLLSLFVHLGIVKATSASQQEAKVAGTEFFRAEGILPAPESAYALAAVRRLAFEARDDHSVVVVCLSGSGVLDAPFYSG